MNEIGLLLDGGRNEQQRTAIPTFIPKVSRVARTTSIAIRNKDLFKQVLVVALVQVPMLHGVADITRLHDVLNHNGCTGIVGVVGPAGLCEGGVPALLAKVIQLGVENIRGENLEKKRTVRVR